MNVFLVSFVSLVIFSDLVMLKSDTDRLVYGDFVKQMEQFKEYSGYENVPEIIQEYQPVIL